MRFLRTNTAVIITVGPFYDKTDGVTIETGLTISNERITLTADTDAGSAPTNILDNVTGATSGTDNDLNYITGNDAGMMQLELSAANTNRLGRMLLSITDAANHVPVFHEFMVMPALVYDTFFASSGGATFPAATLASTTNITAGTVTTATNVTTVNGLAANVITAASMAADASAEIADAVWDEDATAHQTQGTFGQAIGDPAADTNSIYKAVVTDATGATVGVDVVAIKAETVNILADTAEIGAAGAGLTALATQVSVNDLPTNAELATALGTADDAVLSAVATLQTSVDDLPTNAELATALGTADDAVLAAVATVDTVVDAIKVKTDQLTFTKANELDSNLQSVNGVTVNGDGAGTPMGVQMSLTVDGFWKAGFWSTTFWADGFWYEGAPVPPTPPVTQAMGGLSSSRHKKTYYIERDGKRVFFHNEREVYDLLYREEEKAVKKAKKAIKRVTKAEIAELITFNDLDIPKPKLLMKFNDAGINREIDKINQRIQASFTNALIRHIEIMEEEDAFLELLFQQDTHDTTRGN